MTINPFIPIWLMVVICIALGASLIRVKKVSAIIRRAAIILMLFMINLRMYIPGDHPEVKLQSSDVYVMFVIDDTISMVARDYNNTETERLTALKEDCAALAEGLQGAKMSVVTFHNSANIMSPYTDNVDHIISVIKSIYPLDSLYAHGTSMSTAKDTVYTMLKRTYEEKEKKTIVFFISDGEVTNDKQLAESWEEVRQYVCGGAVLGYGSEKGGEMWLLDKYDDDYSVVQDYQTGQPAISHIDETNLRSIASDLGIEYMNMNYQAALEPLIRKLVKENNITYDYDVNITIEGEYTEDILIYWGFVAVLAGLVGWEYVVQRRRR